MTRNRRDRILALTGAGLAVALLGWGIVWAAVLRSPTRYADIAFGAEIVPLAHGRLLITDFGTLDRTGGQVVETDYHDHLLWRFPGRLVNPHSAYPDGSGHILIADTGDNRVIEVNQAGKIVWSTDNLGGGKGRLGQGRLSDGSQLRYPNDAKKLPNGDIMISCRLQNRVVIITRGGHVVRSIAPNLNRQHNPDILPNGHILIADSGWNRVVEVDRKDRIVWQYGSPNTSLLNWPRDANLLPNGHILITDSDHDRIIELTRSRHIVRQWTGLQRPYSAASLSNGNILVGDGPGPGVVELNRKDQIVWKLNHNLKGYLSNLPWNIQNGGFESSAGASTIPARWHRNDALAYSLRPTQRVAMVRDSHVHHGGGHSGRITYRGDSNGIYFSQYVRVIPGHTYRFTGWIKTHNVRACHPCVYGPGGQPGHTAEYQIAFYPGQGGYPPAPLLPQYSGTVGWTRDTTTFTIPHGMNAVEIDGYLRGQGTVWFDDVSLRKVG